MDVCCLSLILVPTINGLRTLSLADHTPACLNAHSFWPFFLFFFFARLVFRCDATAPALFGSSSQQFIAVITETANMSFHAAAVAPLRASACVYTWHI